MPQKKAIVVTAIALLLAALAGMEWVAEHQWAVHEDLARPAEVADPGLPEVREFSDDATLASPRFSR
jgi:regulator of protease activity HflC (stomatin/prohibitin superfamily)